MYHAMCAVAVRWRVATASQRSGHGGATDPGSNADHGVGAFVLRLSGRFLNGGDVMSERDPSYLLCMCLCVCFPPSIFWGADFPYSIWALVFSAHFARFYRAILGRVRGGGGAGDTDSVSYGICFRMRSPIHCTRLDLVRSNATNGATEDQAKVRGQHTRYRSTHSHLTHRSQIHHSRTHALHGARTPSFGSSRCAAGHTPTERRSYSLD